MEGTKNRVKIPFFIIITYILNLYIGFNYASLQFTLLEMKTEFQISSTLMATITSEVFMPARCCRAPEMPQAM